MITLGYEAESKPTVKLRKNFDDIGDMLSIFTAYPDIFLDFITPEDSNFGLFFYQRFL